MKDDERIFRRASDNDDTMNNMIINHWFYVLSKRQIFFNACYGKGKKRKLIFFLLQDWFFLLFVSFHPSLNPYLFHFTAFSDV